MSLEGLMLTAYLTPACDSLVGVIGSENYVVLPRVTQLSNDRVWLRVLSLLDSTPSAILEDNYI